ncbi:serine hydrolase domain-containing protein [Arthrobacter nitrophenolicus]|uniref:Class A beta-lactamase-related serine hydrolase n=1 Tax=Arthrobacter nitrophenolicus TaxID=683150 RepID=A0A4R5Y5M5_9MICC|nr:serine hydrolase domain-containing protein [Arthrobacter nitrophenolicus]TDL38967.1 class A beta-lactamase-related serine hydrolase [Arthrobacter nitrophenolicus]
MGTRRGGRGWQRTAAALCAAVLVAAVPGCIGPPEPPDRNKPAAIALLEAFSSRMVDDGAPAVLFDVTSGGDTWTHAAGVRSLATREAATVADPVHIGTITESMVAVSVLKLVEEGRLDLDGQASDYLPEFGAVLKPPGPVSVRQLLTHESGLPDFSLPLLASGRWEELAGRPLPLEQQLGLAATVPWDGRLARIFDYSRSNYAALALIVERLRGQDIGLVLAADIAGPLRLTSTTLGGPPSAGMVHGYVTIEGTPQDAAAPAWLAEAPSNGAVSTVQEVNRFYAALLQGRLLDPDTVTAMKGGYSQYYGFALRRWNNTCNNRFYYGLPGDVDGYGTVAMTSEDGSKQLAMTVAYPPGPPTLGVNPLLFEMQEVAQEAMNSLC